MANSESITGDLVEAVKLFNMKELKGVSTHSSSIVVIPRAPF